MIIDGLLPGIFGNCAYDIIKDCCIKVFNIEDDEHVNNLYQCIEKASKKFFEKYNNTYGEPSSSFLARQENYEYILKSIYYGNKEQLKDKINPKGFAESANASPESIQFFINTLLSEMKQNFDLDKILAEKEHIQETSEIREDLKTLINALNAKEKSTTEPNHKEWIVQGLGGNDVTTKYVEGEKYIINYPNGVRYELMIKNGIVYVEYTPENELTAYYEMDFHGGVRQSQFPHDLREYKLEIKSSDIINQKAVDLPQGSKQVLYTLKWGRTIEVAYNNKGQIIGFRGEGGWGVSHIRKKIFPNDDLKNMKDIGFKRI